MEGNIGTGSSHPFPPQTTEMPTQHENSSMLNYKERMAEAGDCKGVDPRVGNERASCAATKDASAPSILQEHMCQTNPTKGTAVQGSVGMARPVREGKIKQETPRPEESLEFSYLAVLDPDCI